MFFVVRFLLKFTAVQLITNIILNIIIYSWSLFIFMFVLGFFVKIEIITFMY